MLFDNTRVGISSARNVYARKSSGIKHNRNNRVYELLWFCYLHTKRIQPETTRKIGSFKHRTYYCDCYLKCMRKSFKTPVEITLYPGVNAEAAAA